MGKRSAGQVQAVACRLVCGRLSPLRRRLGATLLVVGLALLADAGLAVWWQEPVSAVYAKYAQAALGKDLDRSEARSARGKGDRRRARKRGARESVREMRANAAALKQSVEPGVPLGRIFIERLNLTAVLVEGASPHALTSGPGHYPKTALPGQRGTVGIAGHRTTFSAPFRDIDQLRLGEQVFIRMPYGLFTYEIEGQEIVSPDRVNVLNKTGEDRLVLTACHPLQSAAQRIVVTAKLVSRKPSSAS